jgi:WD40 repeat protein
MQLWDVDTGRLVASLSGHAGKVLCLAYSPDGTLLASGGHDRTVRLWDVTAYRRVGF